MGLPLALAAFGALSSPSLPAPPACAPGTPFESPAFAAVQARVEGSFRHFANVPAVARLADETLSKLISAQSPAIVEWMRARDSVRKTEDEIVREWRVYHARLFTFAKYPHPDPAITRLIESLVDEIYGQAMTPARLARFERLFGEAKERALERIEALPVPAPAKEAIRARVKGVGLYRMGAFKGSKLASAPLDVVSWGIAYDPRRNEVNLGVEALRYPNDETTFAAFAHELGHAFDPDRWAAFLPGEFPLKGVVSCLQDAAGVKAHQAAEAFADWFSAEVVGGGAYAGPGLRADLCEARRHEPESTYPPNGTRLERIYRANPGIRKKLGLPAGPRYCSTSGP